MSDSETQIITQLIGKYLATREHSKVELLQKLLKKGCEATLSEQIIEQFSARNWQCDRRFAESFVRGAYAKGKGPVFVRHSLEQHNIDSHVVSECLGNEDYDWFDLAWRVKAKKYGDKLDLSYQDKQKQKRFLQYRGFELEQINEVID